MLRSLAILLCALVLMGLAAGSGLDRIARGNPSVAGHVPRFFASEALRAQGTLALSAQRGSDAAAFGWHALNRAPADAEAVSLRAAGLLAMGDNARAEAAFRVAGKLGWRVPVTQAYWLGRALEARDYDVAAMRLDALLRQQPTLVGQQALLDPVERNPLARAALIERLDPRTAWLGKYANELAGLSPAVLLQRAQLLQEAAAAGVVLGCDNGARLVGALVASKLYAPAQALWRAQCPAANTGGLIGDGHFAMLDLQGANPSGLGWQAVGNGDVLLGLVPASGKTGRRLTIDGTPAMARQFLTRLLVLSPGRYRLSWSTGDSAGKPSDRVRAALTCIDGAPVAWAEARLDPASRRWIADLAVGADCPAQRLSFALAPGGGSLWLEAVRLDPLP